MRAMYAVKCGGHDRQEMIISKCPSDHRIKVWECQEKRKTKASKDYYKCLKCWSQEVDEQRDDNND